MDAIINGTDIPGAQGSVLILTNRWFIIYPDITCGAHIHALLKLNLLSDFLMRSAL